LAERRERPGNVGVSALVRARPKLGKGGVGKKNI